jgi:hypothetical protein
MTWRWLVNKHIAAEVTFFGTMQGPSVAGSSGVESKRHADSTAVYVLPLQASDQGFLPNHVSAAIAFSPRLFVVGGALSAFPAAPKSNKGQVRGTTLESGSRADSIVCLFGSAEADQRQEHARRGFGEQSSTGVPGAGTARFSRQPTQGLCKADSGRFEECQQENPRAQDQSHDAT